MHRPVGTSKDGEVRIVASAKVFANVLPDLDARRNRLESVCA